MVWARRRERGRYCISSGFFLSFFLLSMGLWKRRLRLSLQKVGAGSAWQRSKKSTERRRKGSKRKRNETNKGVTTIDAKVGTGRERTRVRSEVDDRAWFVRGTQGSVARRGQTETGSKGKVNVPLRSSGSPIRPMGVRFSQASLSAGSRSRITRVRAVCKYSLVSWAVLASRGGSLLTAMYPGLTTGSRK
jgi:hypothetical protein